MYPLALKATDICKLNESAISSWLASSASALLFSLGYVCISARSI